MTTILPFPSQHSTVHEVKEPVEPTPPVDLTALESALMLKRIGQNIFLRGGLSWPGEACQIIDAAERVIEALASRRL